MQTITIPRAIYRHFASDATAHLDGKGDGKPCGGGWISKRKKCSQKGAQKLAASLKAGDKGAIARVQSGKKKAADRQVLKRAVIADKGKKARDIQPQSGATPGYQDKLRELSNLGTKPPNATPKAKTPTVSAGRISGLKRDVESGSFSTAGFHSKTADRLKTALDRGDDVGVSLSEKSDYGAKVSLIIGGRENPLTKSKMKHSDIKGYFGVESKDPPASKKTDPKQRELARLKKAGFNVKKRKDSRVTIPRRLYRLYS